MDVAVDVTTVGSGPNGLSTAVICARAGRKTQVIEAQPTLGGGARTAADPRSHPASRRQPGTDGGGRKGDRGGGHAQCPMVLAAALYIADPGRIDSQGRRPFWTYAHVPSGSTLDATEAVTATVERFAAVFRDAVVAARAIPAAHLSDRNANYVGGDIGMGGNSAWRAIAGPTPRLDPWRTPIPKTYLCSAATPPGGGVHGMAGLLRRTQPVAPRVWFGHA